MQYSQDPHPQRSNSQKGRTITISDVLPKEKIVQAPHQAPQPGGPAPGRQAPRTSGFEGQ